MSLQSHARIRALAGAIGACAMLLISIAGVAHAAGLDPVTADVSGRVADSATGLPLQAAQIEILKRDQVVATVISDAFGRFLIHNIATGTYTVRVRRLGFRAESRDVRVADGGTINLDFELVAAPITLAEISVSLAVPITIDTRNGDQQYQEDEYHGAPSSTTSQILQQVITGAARAPTGEVHIRGQHAEYTYYVDGIPVPPGISGSLNEIFDPAVIDRISFVTGGWDAEYGNRNTAIVAVQTKVPTGAFHLGLSLYGGSYATNGQSINLSSSDGPWGFYLAASRQASDMRHYPVAYDTITFKPFNYSNQGTDAFGFAKVSYAASARDLLYLEGNASGTNFQIPFDSATGIIQDEQQDRNNFVNFGWRHLTGSPSASPEEPGGELFTGVFYRTGSLAYTPGENDQPIFIFFPDTTPYNLRENRNFQTTGLVANYGFRTGHALSLKFGTYLSRTTGHENFATFDSAGNPGPVSNSNLNGGDADAYVQTVIAPAEWYDFHLGLRYDNHEAPFAGHQDQWSPRIRVNFYPSAGTTIYLYYGRLFMPTNVEDLRSITSVADSNIVTQPTLPERDNFYEVGFVQRYDFGMVMKLAGFYKVSSPGIDDQTVPGSAIVTSVNISEIRVKGLEATFEIKPPGPWSGYLNLSLNHAYGRPPITGGFFPVDTTGVPGGWFDLDHDQRISSVASVVYSAHRFYVSATGIYGTGLTNGAAITSPIGTAITSFNRDIHVKPNFIANLSFGYTFLWGKNVIRPELFIDNVLNDQYLLKGQFFSGASAGRPRTIQLQLTYNM